MNPGKQTLYFPTPAIASEFSPVLCYPFSPVAFMRCYHFNLSLFELLVQRVAIISQITNDFLRFLFDKPCRYRFLYQFHFMGIGFMGPYGDRKTISVCDCHDLGAFTAFSFSNIKPPFLALAKVPSIKHSVMSIFPRFFISTANLWSILSHVPDLHNSWKYRWQVWYGGYRSGMSCHGAPVRQTHRMPSITPRMLTLGLPRVPASFFGYFTFSEFEITSHCSSFKSMVFLQNSDAKELMQYIWQSTYYHLIVNISYF